MVRKLLMLVASLSLLYIGAKADEGYQLWINGTHSKFSPSRWRPGGRSVNFPVDSEETQWTVTVRRDDSTHRVEVKMSPVRRKTRGDTPCHICLTTGKCQHDWPAGSGITPLEHRCLLLGTGKCPIATAKDMVGRISGRAAQMKRLLAATAR